MNGKKMQYVYGFFGIKPEQKFVVPVVIGIPLLLIFAQAYAADIEPRSYVNTPVGVNFLLAGYVYSEGGLSTEGSSTIQDANLSMDTEVLAYVRSLDVWGKSGKFDIILPYSELSVASFMMFCAIRIEMPKNSKPVLWLSSTFLCYHHHRTKNKKQISASFS